MRTIVFYSFKGGTGRSLALAQLAVTLHECGKSVFLLDLDLGAPGLVQKLAPTFKWLSIPHYGVVEYLDIHKDGRPLEPLEPRLLEPRRGFRLFPAGDPVARDDDYWRTYMSRGFQNFLAEDQETDSLFDRLKKKIEDDFQPDFLLVDAPSGVSRLAIKAIRVLADEVVCLSANHLDGLGGTNFIMRMIQQARDLQLRAPKKWYCILTRLPLQYTRDSKVEMTSASLLQTIRTKALQIINAGLNDSTVVEHLYSFSSEPLLELEESLPMEDERMLTSALVQDYINCFSALVPDLAEVLGARRKARQVLRPFMLIEEEGRMLNPADNSPNVALRVDTLVRAFSSMAEGLGAEQAGYDAASRFSKFLAGRWKVEGAGRHGPSTKDKLDEWCKFDSSVGFGRFVPKLWGEGWEGSIELQNNFLIEGRSKSDANLCSFMGGYIKKILEAVFEGSVTVEHDLAVDCGQYKDDVANCTFRFKTTPGQRAAV